MTHATMILCGEAASDHIPGEGTNVLRLRHTGSHWNVRIRIDEISQTFSADIPPQLVDLIEIAAFIYVADQCISRGGADVENMGENWRRRMRFEIPVRKLDFWQRTEVGEALHGVLSFLSEDEYEFVFRQCRKPPPLSSYLGWSGHDDTFCPEAVVLFSGGLDSLGGAVEEVVSRGRSAVLVTHQSNDKLINRHRMLRQLLDARAAGPRPLHVTVTINKDKRLEKETTQRSRSFLYASLAATIARMCGLAGINFFENGTVSLNLPISRQIVGAKATRTTHPRVLAGFQKLFSLLHDGEFSVQNRFLWRTKGEIVQSIIAAGCGNMIEWSTSCTHTRIISLQKPHCGRCSQCIDRRFAVLAGGGESFERGDSYGLDLLADSRDEGEPRTMVASYVETAQQVADMSETQFLMRYGEVARVVRHVDGTPEQVTRQVYELYRRHGKEIVKVIDDALSHYAPQIRARSLPVSCTLRLVHDPTVPGGGQVVQQLQRKGDCDDEYFLRQRGSFWEIRFNGHEPQTLTSRIGYVYLRELLRVPHRALSVADLLVRAHGPDAAVPLGDAGEISGRSALAAYAVRLKEIDGELEDAERDGDVASRDRLVAEREKLLVAVREGGFLGKLKRAKSDRNLVRNSVCNAIKRALAPLANYEPSALAHLTASLHYGFSVRYAPERILPWSF